MLKRLLIAVLALSFVLAFTGTAFSDVNPYNLDLDTRTAIKTVDQNAPKFGVPLRSVHVNANSRPEGIETQLLPAGISHPAPPLDGFCLDLWYDAGAAVFTTVGATGHPGTTRDFMNVRYTSDDNYSCTLKTFWLALYGPSMVGTPDLMVYLWEDDGLGQPGLALDSILVPNASLPVTYSWISVDFESSPNAPAGGWVFSDGEEYHYGTSARGTDTDVIAYLMDDATSATGGRTGFYDPIGATWGSYLAFHAIDRMNIQSSEYCAGEIPFSDCYSQSYFGSFDALLALPDDVYANTHYAVRYDVGGPETLTSVDVVLYDAGQPFFSTSAVNVTVLGDAAGLPDPGNVLWTGAIPPGYTHGWNNLAVGIVVDAPFHVSYSSDYVQGAEYELLVIDAADGASGRQSTSLDGGASYVTMVSDWGQEFNIWAYANMCTDQFSDCETQAWHGGAAWGWTFSDTIQQNAAAVRMTADGQNCQINEVSWALASSTDPLAYSSDLMISVHADGGGQPGAELASIAVPAGTEVYYPAYQTVDFHALDVYITGDYWIQVRGTGGSDFRLISDDVDPANGARSAIDLTPVAPGLWLSMFDAFGPDYGFLANSSHCCFPHDAKPRVCLPGTDNGWATLQGGQGRTGASMLPVGDAWCNLNLNWSFDGPNGVLFSSPVIYGDKAVCAFSDQYVVIDLLTGTQAYAPIDASAGDGFLIGTAISCTPTIANIGGVDMMFIAGGSRLSTGAIDFNTGLVIWQNTLMSGAGIWAKTSFTSFTVLDVAGTAVVYHTTDDGRVLALDALTGALFPGWAVNPIALTGNPYASGATDGTNLFYSTQDAGTEGDIYSINGADGTINWQLSTAGGLQGPLQTGYVYPEGFRSGVAYQDSVIFAVSWANDGGVSDHPLDGFFYQIDASDGTHIVPPTATNRALYASPIVDGDWVYAATISQYIIPTDPTGGNLIAFLQKTGTQVWGTQTADDGNYYNSGILSCEPDAIGFPAPDLIFVFNDNGFFECYNSITGEQIFNRRVDHGGTTNERGMGGAMAMTATDGLHMLFADQSGELYDFKLGADRPRLEVQSFQLIVPVEFGTNVALIVDLGPIIVNTGCLDLNITLATADENPISGASFPDFASSSYVSEDIMVRANAISDFMQREAFLSKFTIANNTDVDAIFDVNTSEREVRSSSFSAGIPAWLVSVDNPGTGDIIAPGDTSNLVITVNQPLVSRGQQSFYIAWESDDPDYFLNADANANGHLPEIQVTVIGGCLIDTTTLHFGMGAANIQLVTNTGRLGTGDWDPHGFDISSDGGSFYQGAYVYGIAQFQVATNSQDWLSGGSVYDNEDAVWNGLQADPNYIDDLCKPALIAGVAVGAISTDGLTYDPITADMVCKTFVDSVTSSGNIVDTAVVGSFGWSDWEFLNFDDTLSIGIMAKTRTIGVIDVPELANFTLEILDFNERNGVDSVTGWYFGQITDYDVGGDDGAMDQTISAAWAYNPGGTTAWGTVKIPFGCGTVGSGQDFDYAPTRAIKVLDGDQALFWQAGANGTQGGPYWDSCYQWLSLPSGSIGDPQVQAADFEMHTSHAKHDFEPNGTYSVGIANFGVHGMANNASGAELADMAHMANKWAGFGRGDVNNDGGINLADIIYLANGVNNAGPGAIPFAHLGDVNADAAIDAADIAYLVDYYFNCGPCPMGDWMF